MIKDFFDSIAGNRENDFDKENNPNASTSIPEDRIKAFLSRLGEVARKGGHRGGEEGAAGIFPPYRDLQKPAGVSCG